MADPKVFFVATPIGNLDEITFRAVETLKNADEIYCEDTRRTLKLLARYGLSKPLFSYHKFNEKKQTERIIRRVREGADVALLSDAGMPGISDPGSILVRGLREAGIGYTAVSGATALINAFVLSGFSPPFTFVGFLPEKAVDRKKLLEGLSPKTVLIFYSSVHDINADLDFLYSELGARGVCVARELTKMYETLYFGELGNISIGEQKGEFVIVLDKGGDSAFDNMTIAEHVEMYTGAGMPKMDAIKQAAKDRGIAKSEVYAAVSKKD